MFNCKYHLAIPTVGLCCEAYYKSKRNDGREWMHFPFCEDQNCPLKHPDLLHGATLETNLRFFISDRNGTNTIECDTREDLLKEMSSIIDNCINNEGSVITFVVDADCGDVFGYKTNGGINL